MQNAPETTHPTSVKQISQQKLADFPTHYIAIFCCRRDRLIPVADLLTEFAGLTVAETIDRLADTVCPFCNQEAKAVYLQSNVSRRPGCRPEHHGSYAQVR